MKDVIFGLSRKPDPDSSGIHTSVAINNQRKIVEMHCSEGASTSLWYRIGHPNQMDVRWSESHALANDNGTQPSVCINDKGTVVEVHKAQYWNKLWYHVGQTNGDKINWGSSGKYDSGELPSIAIDNDGWCIEAHSSEGAATGLWYRLGRVDAKNKTIEWQFGEAKQYDKGYRPQVAMNNEGIVIEVHNNVTAHNTLWYTIGILDKHAKTIHWGNHIEFGNGGTQPSVAITNDGFVIETHQSEHLGTLWRHIGRVDIDNKKIEWSGSTYFDDGKAPSVACTSDGAMAVQTHESENFATLWYSTSLITDRSNWMHDNIEHLRSKSLKQVTLPASHDSGMYSGSGFEVFAKTQDLNIYEQLSYGIRYFDLRPGWDGSDFYIYHTIKGPKLSQVLKDIKRFMDEGHRELVILKFSHYQSFTNEIYKKMAKQMQSCIGQWLFTTKPSDSRLADIPLGDYIKESGTILAICDKNYPVENPTEGIWGYQDWNTTHPLENDLRVFDTYSDTMSYDTMKQDQIKKYNNYNGTLENCNKPCDQFLLSWTLTPPTFVWAVSKSANRNLGKQMAQISVPNQSGCIPNLIYVDYVQYAWVTDCVISMNQKIHSKSILINDEYLAVGRQLLSPNGKYSLILQDDGNLVLYEDGHFKWNSGTNGMRVTKAVQQTDGNFVLYQEGGHPVWSSGTYGNRHAYLRLQDDGNLVIYSADDKWL